MTLDDQRILAPILQPHAKNALECARINQDVLDKLVGAGMHMFSDNTSFQQAYEQVRNSNGASEHYMSKTRSTLKQIVRDWSREG